MADVAEKQRVHDLGPGFAGEVIAPGHPGYDEARGIFNGMFDKRPALIARCTGPGDVRAALAHARTHGLTVAVRGGGHSIPGHSTCDDGIVIDTGPMKGVAIDAERGLGRFGAGLTWGELDAATQEHGRAVTGGRVTHTGIAGLTLGSGSGWLERMYGATAESLLSVTLVTADGRVLRASADENAELFWGLRGAGGNFGIVTEFEFRLHRVGPIVFAGIIMHPRARAKELARVYRDFMQRAPDEVGGGFALVTGPPEGLVPEEARGQPACGVILFYVGDPEKGAEAFRPLLDWGEPWVRIAGPMPYTALQAITDSRQPWGIRMYAKVDYVRELPDAAIDVMVDAAEEAVSPHTVVYLCPLGGAVARMDRGAMALSIPDAPWMYYCLAQWWDPAMTEPEIAWARGFGRAMRPWTVDEAPANFIGADEGAARLNASYGRDKLRRLVALKDAYDPENVFSLNPNISPNVSSAG